MMLVSIDADLAVRKYVKPRTIPGISWCNAMAAAPHAGRLPGLKNTMKSRDGYIKKARAVNRNQSPRLSVGR